MIYEKRTVSLSHFTENETGRLLLPKAPSSDIGCDLHNFKESRCNIRKKPRSKFRFSGVLVFASIIFCLYAADSRILNYKLKTTIVSGIETFAKAKLSHSEVSEISDSPIPERTLYTLSYSEPQHTKSAPSLPVIEAEEATPVSEESLEVSSVISQSFVDGTKYYPIVTTSLAPQNVISISNETSFKIDAMDYAKNPLPVFDTLSLSDGPSVLILHTHACESYSEYSEAYPENAPTRNEDAEKNMVRVGKEIASTLAEFGISSVHCDTLHDKDSFINAYSESADSVRHYLEQYPSIKFVIDVHRDAIIRDNGESVRAVTKIAGEDYAQIMFVVGTNELGHNHPGWKQNLALAVNLQESISDTYPGLCRSINLRNVPFNQQLSSGYLLLEVGTSANTLDEALRSSRAFAQELARIITESVRNV